nr:MAG TPA: hypothetical protein [Bacteriophage sp.]
MRAGPLYQNRARLEEKNKNFREGCRVHGNFPFFAR